MGPSLAGMAGGFKTMGAPENLMLALVTLATRSGSLPSMPTFTSAQLSDAQLADVASYVWSIAATQPAAAALPKTGDEVSRYSLILGGLGLLSLAAGAALRLRGRSV